MSKNSKKNNKANDFAIPKQSFKFIIAGFCVVVLGLILMVGGGSDDPSVFNEEIYGFQRTILAPMVVLGGFVFILYAILHKPKIKE